MLKVYGMKICPDTVECCEALNRARVEYEFLDFAEKTANLKAFLKLRDSSPLFDSSGRRAASASPAFSGRTAASLLTGKNLCKEAQGLRPELFSLDRHVPGTVLSGGFRGVLRGACGVLHQRAIAVIDGFIGFMGGGRFGGRMGGRRGRCGRHPVSYTI